MFREYNTLYKMTVLYNVLYFMIWANDAPKHVAVSGYYNVIVTLIQ
jgi:hypothetical protein